MSGYGIYEHGNNAVFAFTLFCIDGDPENPEESINKSNWWKDPLAPIATHFLFSSAEAFEFQIRHVEELKKFKGARAKWNHKCSIWIPTVQPDPGKVYFLGNMSVYRLVKREQEE